MAIIKPFDDEYLVFNKDKKRYVLTNKCILDELSINLNLRFNSNGFSNVTLAINAFLDRISLKIYTFIYKHNNQQTLEWIISCCESARRIIKEAMKCQALYMLMVGDVSMSLNKDERDFSIDSMAKDILLQTVEETGTCLLYTGDYR